VPPASPRRIGARACDQIIAPTMQSTYPSAGGSLLRFTRRRVGDASENVDHDHVHTELVAAARSFQRTRADGAGAAASPSAPSARAGLEATMARPGGVPERPKGTGCKPVGSAYGGSNPPAPTVRRIATLVGVLCPAGYSAFGGEARVADLSNDALIHADATRALGYTGKGVTVAILDTGVDDHNPGLEHSVIAEHSSRPTAARDALLSGDCSSVRVLGKRELAPLDDGARVHPRCSRSRCCWTRSCRCSRAPASQSSTPGTGSQRRASISPLRSAWC
jgi:hypothetical protein